MKYMNLILSMLTQLVNFPAASTILMDDLH